MLNLLFGSKLTPWDAEFIAGRHPVQFRKIGRRTVAGERWHNTGWTFPSLVKDLTEKISCQLPENQGIGTWASIGIGIASLFAIFSQLYRVDILKPGDSMDVAVNADDLLTVISAVFAKNWGLPIGTVVCGCEQSDGLWELLHNGEMASEEIHPNSERITDSMEILLWELGGAGETMRFLRAVEAGRTYIPGEPVLRKLRSCLSASVIGEERVLNTIPGVWSSHHYILDPGAATAYAGLLDYRAVSGASCWGMVLCDRSPSLDTVKISQALHCPETELEKILRKS